MEQTVFTRTPFDIETAGCEGNHITLSYKVDGFWADKINVYIRRDYYGEVAWHVDINSSSGGSETGYDQATGIRNFAAALLDAAELADLVRANTDKLEANYQLYREQLRAEFEQVNQKRQAAIDADEALGTAKAKDMIQAMVSRVKESDDRYHTERAVVYPRGEDRTYEIVCSRSYANVVLAINGSVRQSRREALDKMATSSHRTYLKEEMVA